MAPRLTRKIKSSLLKKSFKEDNSRHLHFRLHVDGEKTHIFTVISHGAQECSDHILGKMAKQLKLSRTELNDLIDCAMGGEAYIEVLKERGDLRGSD
jgi:hypothetical protein